MSKWTVGAGFVPSFNAGMTERLVVEYDRNWQQSRDRLAKIDAERRDRLRKWLTPPVRESHWTDHLFDPTPPEIDFVYE